MRDNITILASFKVKGDILEMQLYLNVLAEA